jgi:peptidoglycan hydrolase-like protein with peptidoglycan-binding domain
MGTSSVRRQDRKDRARRRRRKFFLRALLLLAVVGCGLGAAVIWWSGATLAEDSTALARVELQPLGGSLVSATASGPGGARIPLTVKDRRLTPGALLAPGVQVNVVVVVQRPRWLAWALGHRKIERLTVRTPTARLTGQWLTVPGHAPVQLHFAAPVAKVSYRIGQVERVITAGGRVVSLGSQTASGTAEVSSAARSWERTGDSTAVSWFPPSAQPVVLVSPAPGHTISPLQPIRLTFSQPLKEAIGDAMPRLSDGASGSWRATDSHTVVFTPNAFGFPFASSVRLKLPREADIGSGNSIGSPGRTMSWEVPGASFLRLQQLLAGAGYLPLSWSPAGSPVPRQRLAEADAAINPPAGKFSWRYPNTPPELQQLWIPSQPNTITRGAVMMFEHDHGLAVDGIAGEGVWRALLADAVAGKQHTGGYSYVYVHRNVPQLLTLWHNGQIVLTSPGNTGVPAAPTALGTFAVFEHIPVGTMRGTNPNGTRYDDPGIRWISYFHRGEALHSFNRASYGTPQSLGCVELPLAVAAQVWPYTPIGTLVTIEN